MKRRTVVRVAFSAYCLAVSACLGPGGNWQIPSFMRPPAPRPAPVPQYQPSAGKEINGTYQPAESQKAAHRRARHSHVVPAAIPTAAPAAQPAPQPLERPTVTLANGSSKERAQQLLDNAGAKLARVQRSALGAESASTYDQANTLLQAGRKAATDEDYVAASGYAEKAATLADKLSSGTH
jgi:hypothetical protein